MAITVQIPEDIESTLSDRWHDLPRKALEAIALEGYRQGAISQGQVGGTLGLNFWETEAFLKQHDAYIKYDTQDLEDDLTTLREMDSH